MSVTPSVKEPIAMSWSGGKDSSFALYEVIRQGKYKVSYLITTVTKNFDRISMHGVRRELLQRQSDSIGIPVIPVEISYGAGNEEYEKKMGQTLEALKKEGISKVAFGDIYLEDIRSYREERMSRIGMSCIFPIWGRDPNTLSREIIASGIRATICTVDLKKLGREFAGREYGLDLLKDLPPGVDPCGERGEFHTFAYDGPVFRHPISFTKGEVVERDSFCFVDLVPT